MFCFFLRKPLAIINIFEGVRLVRTIFRRYSTSPTSLAKKLTMPPTSACSWRSKWYVICDIEQPLHAFFSGVFLGPIRSQLTAPVNADLHLWYWIFTSVSKTIKQCDVSTWLVDLTYLPAVKINASTYCKMLGFAAKNGGLLSPLGKRYAVYTCLSSQYGISSNYVYVQAMYILQYVYRRARVFIHPKQYTSTGLGNHLLCIHKSFGEPRAKQRRS